MSVVAARQVIASVGQKPVTAADISTLMAALGEQVGPGERSQAERILKSVQTGLRADNASTALAARLARGEVERMNEKLDFKFTPVLAIAVIGGLASGPLGALAASGIGLVAEIYDTSAREAAADAE